MGTKQRLNKPWKHKGGRNTQELSDLNIQLEVKVKTENINIKKPTRKCYYKKNVKTNDSQSQKNNIIQKIQNPDSTLITAKR